MHRPRSSRHWPVAILLCGAVISGVSGTATQSEAGALKWSPVNIPTTFPNLLCPAPGFCVGVKERQKSYEVVGDAAYRDVRGWRVAPDGLAAKGTHPARGC